MAKAWPALDIHVPSCDPQLQELVLAELDDFQPTAIQQSDETSWLRAFFGSAASRTAAARALATAFGHYLLVQSIDVDDENWAERSQSDLRAVTIGRLIVAPPWDAPGQQGRAQPLLVVIQPSMGFGTGHHATTRLALKALQSLDLNHRTVLDVGCGSGVLAIAAVRLGAGAALGIDVDPDALTAAKDNLDLNNVGGLVRFEEADFRQMTSPSGVVVANLTGALLERSASALARLVEPGGFLIVSGFMGTETAALPALETFLSLQKVDQEDEWLCAVLQKPIPNP